MLLNGNLCGMTLNMTVIGVEFYFIVIMMICFIGNLFYCMVQLNLCLYFSANHSLITYTLFSTRLLLTYKRSMPIQIIY